MTHNYQPSIPICPLFLFSLTTSKSRYSSQCHFISSHLSHHFIIIFPFFSIYASPLDSSFFSTLPFLLPLFPPSIIYLFSFILFLVSLSFFFFPQISSEITLKSSKFLKPIHLSPFSHFHLLISFQIHPSLSQPVNLTHFSFLSSFLNLLSNHNNRFVFPSIYWISIFLVMSDPVAYNEVTKINPPLASALYQYVALFSSFYNYLECN